MRVEKKGGGERGERKREKEAKRGETALGGVVVEVAAGGIKY